MAGAAAEAGTAEKAAKSLKPGFWSHPMIALVLSRDTPMRATRCQSPGLELKLAKT
jgi:hypothetical protein